MINKVSIRWKSAGYSVLKNLNSSVLGIFCEFIDNSIQSYRDNKDQMLKIDPKYKLRITITYDRDEIRIKDNAGGINAENFKRALEPANTPDNTNGLNEFGMGMKYAAVWIANEWELKSSAIGEKVKRSTLFDYDVVTSQDIEELDVIEEKNELNSHFTEVILRKLERKRTFPWQSDYLKSKLSFIYRNFLREKTDFHSNWCEDIIELNFEGERLKWEEVGFLKKWWWKDKQVEKKVECPEFEWKYKFDWTPIDLKEEVIDKKKVTELTNDLQISGFIGILPDGKHNKNNGFTLFRRGRVVEGINGRIYPIDISGRSARSFKYIRLYGELHFKNAGVSFDKTKLNINNERREEIFGVIATLIKNVDFGTSKKYNLIEQADKYRVGFSLPNSKKAIENLIESRKHNEDQIIELPDNNYSESNSELVNSELKPISPYPSKTIRLGQFDYKLDINFVASEEEKDLYFFKEKNKNINITINMNHPVLQQDKKNNLNNKLEFFVSIIECLTISEILALGSGLHPKFMRYRFNEYISQFINKN